MPKIKVFANVIPSGGYLPSLARGPFLHLQGQHVASSAPTSLMSTCIDTSPFLTLLLPSFFFFKEFLYLFIYLKFLFIYLVLAVLGLCFCARAFSSCGKRGPLFIAVRGPLTIAAPPVAGHKLQTRRFSSCGSRAQLLRGMWDLPRPGLELVSPALAGRFSTTAPPGKPPASLL